MPFASVTMKVFAKGDSRFNRCAMTEDSPDLTQALFRRVPHPREEQVAQMLDE